MLSCVHPMEAAVRRPVVSATCSGTTSTMSTLVKPCDRAGGGPSGGLGLGKKVATTSMFCAEKAATASEDFWDLILRHEDRVAARKLMRSKEIDRSNKMLEAKRNIGAKANLEQQHIK